MNMKMIIILAVGSIILIGASIGGTLFFTGYFENASGAQHSSEIDYSHSPPNYLEIKPSFVANAVDGNRLRFVMIDIAIMARNPAAIEAVEKNLIGVRNSVREALSGHPYREVSGQAGIALLRSTAEEAAKKYLEERHLPLINAIYFTSMIIQ